jgi:hypothetical protein
LQEVRKGNSQSCVYRLGGVGRRGASVFAKRCTARYAHVERSIYQEILPHLPISNLTLYGCVEQPETTRLAQAAFQRASTMYSPGTASSRIFLRNMSGSSYELKLINKNDFLNRHSKDVLGHVSRLRRKTGR